MLDCGAKMLQRGFHAALCYAVGGFLESFVGGSLPRGQKPELDCWAFNI